MNIFPSSIESDDFTYAREAACVDAAEILAEALEAAQMSRAQLARLLSISRAEVTRRLQGSRNMTVSTLAETLLASGYRLELSIRPINEASGIDTHADGSARVEAWELPPAEVESTRHSRSKLSDEQFVGWPR
jgi:transcriptional regulator with XRE-family HTH domain